MNQQETSTANILEKRQILASRSLPEERVSAKQWPDILPFDDLELPLFPTVALPQVYREWVEAESEATQTPPDLAGLLALAVCSFVISRRVEVEPRPGWREPVNLFVAVLLEPGNRKSVVFTEATQPLRTMEKELIEARRPAVARALSDRRQKESRMKKLEKVAAEQGDDSARVEAGNLAVELAMEPEPVLPRLLVDDCTPERLAMMLAEQSGRLASMSSEGGVFDLMAGLYSKNGTPQFDVYLKGHSGDDLIVDRVTRKSVQIERPALTCAYAIQPEVFRNLVGNSAFRGRGLLARFLFAAPVSWIGHRTIAPPPVPETVRENYCRAIRSLEGHFEPSRAVPAVLRLTPDAQARFQAWEATVETMLADGGMLESVRDWGGKLCGATLRLAAVIHCMKHGPVGDIGVEAVEDAITIAQYLCPHACWVLGGMNSRQDDDARYVLNWIVRNSRSEFAKREVQQHGKRRFPKADDIDPALEELTRRGYVRRKATTTTRPGRPPSPAFEVNPAVFENNNTKKRSQYSQNSPSNPAEPPVRGNCENIEGASGRFENRVQCVL